MIVNDDSRVINKLEASLTDDTRVIIYDRNMFTVQATGANTLSGALKGVQHNSQILDQGGNCFFCNKTHQLIAVITNVKIFGLEAQPVSISS
jgi:hypothetical protein